MGGEQQPAKFYQVKKGQPYEWMTAEGFAATMEQLSSMATTSFEDMARLMKTPLKAWLEERKMHPEAYDYIKVLAASQTAQAESALTPAGIVGAFPTTNARTSEDLERWFMDITGRIEAGRPQDPKQPHGTWAANLMNSFHQSAPHPRSRTAVQYQPPIVITALGSPRRVVEAVHGYGGLVIADVNSVAFVRKAADVGVDGLLLVASGAGAHTGQMTPSPSSKAYASSGTDCWCCPVRCPRIARCERR